MIDMTEIWLAAIYLLVTLVSALAIPVLKNKVGAQNMDKFLKWVDIAVAAAEQLYSVSDGKSKKEYVLAYLAEKGFSVDGAELDMAIEAAVNRLHRELYGGAK